MTDLLLLLLVAGLLLIVLPQLLALAAGSVGRRRSGWWALVAAMLAAPATYYLLASYLYSPDKTSSLQGTDYAAGRIEASLEMQPAMLAHAAAALVVQLVIAWRSR